MHIQETTSGSVTAQTDFVWCGSERCEARDGLNSDAPLRQYFALGQVNFSGGTGTPYFYTKTIDGSIREMTNGAGTIVYQQTFDPYGQPTQLAGSGPAPDQGFCGYYLHGRSGLNLTWFRAYSPSQGRWISRDPLGYFIGTNLYGYVGNNPLGYTDMLGLSPQDVQRILDTGTYIRDQMTANGQRADQPWQNVVQSGLKNSCVDQSNEMADQVYNTLYPKVGPPGTEDSWTITTETASFLSVHSRARATSSNPNDQDVILDPWLNEFKTVSHGEMGGFNKDPYSERQTPCGK